MRYSPITRTICTGKSPPNLYICVGLMPLAWTFINKFVTLFFLSLCSQLSQTSQKRFICEITGHSGLSFFDALKSEVGGFHGSPYILILKKNREP